MNPKSTGMATYSNASKHPKIRLGRKASVVSANVIENSFFDEFNDTAEIKSDTTKNRTQNSSSLKQNNDRAEIYMDLLKRHSKFEKDDIFDSAPNFFKEKLGIPAIYSQTNHCSDTNLTNSASSRSKRFSRKSSCHGCTSKPDIRDSGHTKSDQAVSKPLGTSNRSNTRILATDLNKKQTCNQGMYQVREDSSTARSTVCPIFPSITSEAIDRSHKPLKNTKNSTTRTTSHTSNNKIQHSKSVSFNRKQEKRPEDKNSRHVFAVKGSLLAIRGSGFENFPNWFADYPSQIQNLRPDQDNLPYTLDFKGFSVREIHIKFVDQNKLVVEAYRPASELFKARRLVEVIRLPPFVPIESLFISRTPEGKLVIEAKN